MKRLNPYQHLLKSIKGFCSQLSSASLTTMFWYEKTKLAAGYRLDDIYERTKAAEQLGYEVILVATDRGLEAKYRKCRPEIPWNWQ